MKNTSGSSEWERLSATQRNLLVFFWFDLGFFCDWGPPDETSEQMHSNHVVHLNSLIVHNRAWPFWWDPPAEARLLSFCCLCYVSSWSPVIGLILSHPSFSFYWCKAQVLSLGLDPTGGGRSWGAAGLTIKVLSMNFGDLLQITVRAWTCLAQIVPGLGMASDFVHLLPGIYLLLQTNIWLSWWNRLSWSCLMVFETKGSRSSVSVI